MNTEDTLHANIILILLNPSYYKQVSKKIYQNKSRSGTCQSHLGYAHNNQLTAFHCAALRPITQNAVGDHICHCVIDRLLFIFQPSHRSTERALQHAGLRSKCRPTASSSVEMSQGTRVNLPIRHGCYM